MIWTILLIKKPDNGWYINYIENKLIQQINKYNLQNYIEILVFKPKLYFNSKYVSVISDEIDISDDYINITFNILKDSNADSIGLKGFDYIDGECYKFNNISENDSEIYLPISKLNPIKMELILNFQNIAYYIATLNLSSVVKTIDSVDKPIIFLYENRNRTPISIIISAYQSQNYIEECLDSIENQTYFINNDNYEVLIGVDACQDTYDKLEEIKYKYRNLSIYMMSENKGTYITTNTLISLVKNEDVIRFDSDDIMTPGLVSEIIKNKKDNDIMMMGSVDLNNGKIGDKFITAEGIIYFKKSMMDNIAGGYMPWRTSADTELISRLVNKVKISQLKKVLFYRRIHSKSLTQSKETGYGSELRNSYKKQIKSRYKDNEIKIQRVVNKIEEIEEIEKIENMPISIFVTAYKTQDYIEECLDSIENQTYFINNDNFEVLVGVDACQNTLNKLLEIRYKYRNLRIFMMDSNKGTYVTSNTLIDLTKYKNIIRFDSDDIMMPDMIETISSYINNFDVIKFGYDNFYNTINNIKPSRLHFPHGVVLYKKEIFDKFGGYQNWLCAADTEFLVRINKHVRIKEIRKRLFLRRQHVESLTRRIDTKYDSDLRNIYKSLIGNHKSDWIEKITNTYIEK